MKGCSILFIMLHDRLLQNDRRTLAVQKFALNTEKTARIAASCTKIPLVLSDDGNESSLRVLIRIVETLRLAHDDLLRKSCVRRSAFYWI